jgi:hypothetical protein
MFIDPILFLISSELPWERHDISPMNGLTNKLAIRGYKHFLPNGTQAK